MELCPAGLTSSPCWCRSLNREEEAGEPWELAVVALQLSWGRLSCRCLTPLLAIPRPPWRSETCLWQVPLRHAEENEQDQYRSVPFFYNEKISLKLLCDQYVRLALLDFLQLHQKILERTRQTYMRCVSTNNLQYKHFWRKYNSPHIESKRAQAELQ